MAHNLYNISYSAGELWLERPLETAMLLSLVGVAGVVSNQWHSLLSENKHKLETCLTGEYLTETVSDFSRCNGDNNNNVKEIKL